MMYGPKKTNQALIDMKIQACERSWPQLVFLFLLIKPFGPSDILKIESYMDTYKSTNPWFKFGS